MFKFLKTTWQELGRSIVEGERYERNMRGIAVGAALIVLINIITGTMNLVNSNYKAAVSSLALIVAGLLILFFLLVIKNRKIALTIAMIAIIIIYSYDALSFTDGIIIFWTLLFPMAFSYLSSVKSGFLISVHFLLLYTVMFYTPLKHLVADGKYPEIIIQRFPILYFADVVLSTYIMVQYHKNTLHQIDYSKQVLEAMHEADRANASKSSFLANMSHEIRTPINAVLGMNEMILRESRSARDSVNSDIKKTVTSLEEIETYAGNVESAGNNLLAIINDILDFSKIEAGKMEIAEADYEFSSVLNDISNMTVFKAKDKGLDFIIDVDESIPDALHGDEVRVRQIITNILNNAVKYTEHGSVTLSVSGETYGEPAPGRLIKLKIIVSDTGIGIRKADIDKLFTKFQRLDLAKTGTVEGTGLGLAITQSLLEMMGGSIKVESEYGSGSVFTVVIPQRIVSCEPVGDFQQRFQKSVLETKAYKESFRAPGARILIVDDTRMNLAVAEGLLKNTELKIDTAISGQEALELAHRTAYDIILMDQRMPEMDGTEAMHHIRADESGVNARTPVICLTADAVIGAKERYLSEGFSDYLTKPIDSRALERMLMKYLPKEKLVIVSAEEKSADDQPSADSELAELESVGISVGNGLGYCGGDAEFYRTLLGEYLLGGREKIVNMRKMLEERDWNNYGITAHALKSTSKMIGASELSERAARLDDAANRGDEAVILGEHGALETLLEKTLDVIGSLGVGSDTDDGDDGEVLEFLPEDDNN